MGLRTVTSLHRGIFHAAYAILCRVAKRPKPLEFRPLAYLLLSPDQCHAQGSELSVDVILCLTQAGWQNARMDHAGNIIPNPLVEMSLP